MAKAAVKSTSSRFIVLTKVQDGALKKAPDKIAIKKSDISSVEEMAHWSCCQVVHSKDEKVNVTESFDEIMTQLE
jgi:hypothetical protein